MSNIPVDFYLDSEVLILSILYLSISFRSKIISNIITEMYRYFYYFNMDCIIFIFSVKITTENTTIDTEKMSERDIMNVFTNIDVSFQGDRRSGDPAAAPGAYLGSPQRAGALLRLQELCLNQTR